VSFPTPQLYIRIEMGTPRNRCYGKVDSTLSICVVRDPNIRIDYLFLVLYNIIQSHMDNNVKKLLRAYL